MGAVVGLSGLTLHVTGAVKFRGPQITLAPGTKYRMPQPLSRSLIL